MPIATLVQKKSLELKKHIGLIHSTNKLSLLERKIANALLYHAYDDLLTKNEHEIHIPSLCVLIGYNSKDYKTIRQSLISLISTVLEWNLVDKNTNGDQSVWMASSMLADAKIDGPICTYSYSNRMRELCHYPEFYGRLNMQVLSCFKSTYGLALYENCIRYQSITQTPWFDLPTFRKLMGVENGKYEIFRDLNRRVIQPAVTEVNQHAPITVSPEFKKQGRAVIAIRFLIEKPAENISTKLVNGDEKKYSTLERLVSDFGIAAKKAEELIDHYGEQYLLDKIRLIETSNSYLNGKIDHLAKYLEKALQDDYKPPKSSKENLEKLRIQREKEEEQRKAHAKNLKKYRSYQIQQLPEILKNLPIKKRQQISKEFGQYISASLYNTLYVRHQFDNPLVQDRFFDFVRKNHVDLLELLLPFDIFCKEC